MLHPDKHEGRVYGINSWIKGTGLSKLRGAEVTGKQTVRHKHPGGERYGGWFPVHSVLWTFTLKTLRSLQESKATGSLTRWFP